MNAIYQNQKSERGTVTRGNWGEAVAAQYLRTHGYAILARQVEYRNGELDIIAAKEGVLFFVEVKTRGSEALGTIEAIDRRKQLRMRHAALLFCREQGIESPAAQFDGIVVLGRPGGATVRVRHYRNCF